MAGPNKHNKNLPPNDREPASPQPHVATGKANDFLHDPNDFRFLETEVAPDLIAHSRAHERPLRVWIADCATGEQAYLFTIVLLEAVQAAGDNDRWPLQIFATDSDERALKIARAGLYGEHIADELSAARLARWFVRVDNGFQATRTLRESLLFTTHDVLSDPPFSQLDLICCRNLLTHPDKQTNERILDNFHFALRPGHWLFVGSSETAADNERGLFSSAPANTHFHRAVETVASASRGLNSSESTMPGTASSHVTGKPRALAPRQRFENSVQHVLLDAFAPASVVTNACFDVLYMHGDVGDYLAFTTGVPPDDLLPLARRGLRAPLREIVNSALAAHPTGFTTITQTARLLRDDHYHPVEMTARALHIGHIGDTGGEQVLITFRDAPQAAARGDQTAARPGEDDTDRAGTAPLEQELQLARGDRQGLIDELQATSEEFRTAHEQALSMKAQLQSANEENESSTQELASFNRETIALSAGLQEKIRELERSHDDIADLLDSMDIATLFLDRDNRIRRFTPATRTLFNLIPADIGRSIDDMSHPFTGALNIEADATEARASLTSHETEQQTSDGRWFLRLVAPYRARDGAIRGVVVSFLDITRLKRTERELAASDSRFRMLFHDNPAMYFIVDGDGQIVSVNEFGAAQLGYTPKELVGASFASMHVRPRRLKSKLERCHRTAGERQRWELQLCGKDGSRIWIRANARVVPSQDDGPNDSQNEDRHVFISCENISNEKRLGEEARFHATHDALTGLINRREFETILAKAIKNGRAKHESHILAYLDLDNFKIINDTYGHQAGDEMLRQLSQCMHGALREDDILARIGGDEFAILMGECSPADADDTARRLITAIDTHEFLWDRHRLRVGACIGLAAIDPAAGGDVDSVLRAADAACFAAKELGPSSIHRHVGRDNRVTRRRNEMSWANRIREALADGRVRIYLQPIVNLRQPDSAHAYEALVRMHNSDGQVVDASDFMEAAVRYGLMQELDRFALAQTLAFMSEHRPRLRDFRWVAVNVSAQSLIHPEFLAFARRTLGESDVDAAGLCFEITETSVISNLSQAQHFIGEMKRLGCSFALDDFGTGLSSFDYLRALPVEHVKIDGSFIRNMRDDVSDLAMVEAVANIAHLMGKTVIAECVENTDLLEAVRGVDIEYAQGFLFGEAQPIDTLLIENAAQPN